MENLLQGAPAAQEALSAIGGSNSIMSFGTMAIAIVMLIVAFKIRPVRNILTGLFSPFVKVTNAVEGKLGFIHKIVSRFIPARFMSVEGLKKRLDKKYAKSDNPLLSGDIEAAARNIYPEDKYASLYIAQPDDLARPAMADGRVISGAMPATCYGGSFVTEELIAKARNNSLANGVLWFALGLVISFYLIHSAPFNSMEVTPNVVQSYFENPVVWSGDAYQAASDTAKDTATAFVDRANVVLSIRTIVVDFVLSVLLACLFTFLAFHGSFRMYIRNGIQQHINLLSNKNKESTVRYKYRQEQRSLEEKAFSKQLEVLRDFDKSKTVTLGKGTGTLKYRGVLSGYREDQPVKMSLMDLMQHLFILGGSGEGKSRSVIRPLIRQILDLRASGEKIAVYATDAKAVLWHDIKSVAEEKGQAGNVRIIGVGEGEHGVDLLEGSSPALVSDILKSAMKQLSGGKGGDEFWVDMASEVIRNVAVIAEVWERTPAGIKRMEEDGERLYSIATIYRMCVNDALVLDAIEDVNKAIQSNYQFVAEFDNSTLWDSLNYIAGEYMNMAANTRSGIQANITNALSGFVSNTQIREYFGSGSATYEMNIADCLKAETITCVNLSSMELGTAARVVNVFLKSLLYREARRAEMHNPNIAQERLCAFIADEFQELATADMSGYSDATFWNVARSSGVMGICASQSLAAIEQAIGKEASENLMLNFRSKLFLRVEDPRSVEYTQKIFGKTLRAYTFEDRFSETLESLLKEYGLPDDPANWSKELDLSDNLVLNPIRFLLSHIGFVGAYETHSIKALQLTGGGLQNNNATTNIGLQQSAMFREEDLKQKFMSEGNHEAEVIRNEDITQMGRSHAVAYIQRAGAARMDIISID